MRHFPHYNLLFIYKKIKKILKKHLERGQTEENVKKKAKDENKLKKKIYEFLNFNIDFL